MDESERFGVRKVLPVRTIQVSGCPPLVVWRIKRLVRGVVVCEINGRREGKGKWVSWFPFYP